MNLYKLLYVASIALITSCASESNDIANIKKLEKALYSNAESVFDLQIAENLVSHYEAFVEANPNDSLAASFLFKGGEISMGMGSSVKAIELYKRVYKEYPDYTKAPTSLFLIGFVHETQNKDMVEAGTYYRRFIAEYPAHNLVDDAKFSLNNLGKSDEDIIREFEAKLAKNKQQDTL